MRRILVALLLAIGLSVSLGAVKAESAQAATCATHSFAIIDGAWDTSADSISGFADFKCGGAENLDFRVVYYLQVWNGSSWVTASCDSGGFCSSMKPSSGYFNAGTEHSWTWTFNFAGQIDCRFFRPRAYAVFSNSTATAPWTGAERQTC